MIASTLAFSFQQGHVSAESIIVMLCVLCNQDNVFEVELKSYVLSQ